MEKLELVKRIDLFAPLSDSERAAVAESLRHETFRKGDIVFREGDTGRVFYGVARGTLAVWRGDPAREVAVLRRGDCFGEMSLLTGEPRTATVVALDESELVVFERPVFMKLFAANVKVAHAVTDIVAARQRELVHFAPSAPSPRATSEARARTAPETNETATETLFDRIRQVLGF